jgi:hypothetical protein
MLGEVPSNYALERTATRQWSARRARERQYARSSRLEATRRAAEPGR